MDLGEIVRRSAKAVQIASPAALSREKSSALYNHLTLFLEQSARPSSAIVGHMLRASSLASLIGRINSLRMAASYDVFASSLVETPASGSLATLHFGTAIHRWFQNEYLGPSGLLWGCWRCLRCQVIVVGRMPSECNCGSSRFEFEETCLGDDILRYRGHPDGRIVEPDQSEPTALVEIKTISTAGWDRLTAPLDDHKIQTHAYMRAPLTFTVSDDGGIVAKPRSPVHECYFIYVDKGKQALFKRRHDGSRYTFEVTSPPRWKVFHIHFDTALWADVETKIKEIWSIHDALKGVVQSLAEVGD